VQRVANVWLQYIAILRPVRTKLSL